MKQKNGARTAGKTGPSWGGMRQVWACLAPVMRRKYPVAACIGYADLLAPSNEALTEIRMVRRMAENHIEDFLDSIVGQFLGNIQ